MDQPITKLSDEDKSLIRKYVTKPYQETIGSIEGLRMLAHMGALGGAGALAGHFGSNLLTPGMGRKLPGAKQKTQDIFTKLGAGLGAAAGAYTGSKGINFDSPKDMLESAFIRDYWKKNPAELRQHLREQKNERLSKDYSPSYNLYDDKVSALSKTSAEGNNISGFMPDIDVNESQEIVNEDPYIDPLAKGKTNQLMDVSDDDQDGFASQFDVGNAALKLGAGFVPSYAAGRVLGGVMRLPKPTKKRLSLVGGLAGAVANTGVLDEI